MWADTFHAGLRNSSEVSQMVADARAGNFNAVIVEVRKRGDAYYNSNFEPKATDVSPQSFDPLADLIAKAHNTNTGPRIEVHAWIVTYNIWNKQSSVPPQPDHPYNLHPDWLTEDNAGNQWDGSNFGFDPAHPEVQEHTFNVCMDIISRYDVDGLNFDYIRYAGPTWGYNPIAVARFNARHGRTGKPISTDSVWKQFRRDQVSALVRKVYLSAIALKPHVKISGDLITWAPGVTSTANWTSTDAYSHVLQDWRAWMEEGILDLGIPMAYFNQNTHPTAWANWNTFAKDHRYNRHIAIGPGTYLNSLSNALFQLNYTRLPSPRGNYADGFSIYSYMVPTKDGISRSAFYTAVRNAVSPAPANPPVMPWKTAPTKGHLKGFVYGGGPTNPLDGASVTITGPNNKNTITDATGFYGAVDLQPGTYNITATASGLGSQTRTVTVNTGEVTTANLVLSGTDMAPPVISAVIAADVAFASATISWATDELADSVVEFGVDTGYGGSVTSAELVIDHSIALTGLTSSTTYHFRVRSTDASGNEAVSGDFTFTTTASGVVNDIIIDNPQATISGSWSTGSSSADKYGGDYRYKSQGSGGAYLQYTPNLAVAGDYQVYAWYPQGGNRPSNAPYAVTYSGGTEVVRVNQQSNGGRWNLLGTFQFNAGSAGYVRITDDFVHDSKVVLADAIKFVYLPPPPPAITAHPQSRSVYEGGNVTFAVSATGAPPLSYQWRFNGVNIPDATGSSYTRSNVAMADAGSYSVRVSNYGGSVLSQAAALTVNEPEPPVLALEMLPGGEARISITGSPGGLFLLEASPDMETWAIIAAIASGNGAAEYTDFAASRHDGRFYRARFQP